MNLLLTKKKMVSRNGIQFLKWDKPKYYIGYNFQQIFKKPLSIEKVS